MIAPRIRWAALALALCGATAQATLRAQPDEQMVGSRIVLPHGYGRLVTATFNDGAHQLYFQDDRGAIRVVVVGPQGAARKVRQTLQLLANPFFVVEFGDGAPH